MSILSGTEIRARLADGRLVIDPPPQKIGPNSADLCIGHTLHRYDRTPGYPLDPRCLPPLVEVYPDADGSWLLVPGELYLAATLEWTETYGVVPHLDGRSSLARLGVFAHCTAGRGDVGFKGRWTLELSCVVPVLLRPGTRCLQITYHEVVGELTSYEGRYQGDQLVAASRLVQS